MTRVLILGAHGQIARVATDLFLKRTDTILRPAWLNDRDEIDYGTTQKGEAFKAAGDSVSRKSVADLVVMLATTTSSKFAAALAFTRRPEQPPASRARPR